MSERTILVERASQIGALTDAVHATSSQGSVVLLSGESGHGKTSLVTAVVSSLDHKYTILRAGCEPVGIPNPFGPLYDIITALPPELADGIKSGAGIAPVAAGLVDVLRRDRVVLIVEDIHWADEATLALVRYIGRRMQGTMSCMVLSFRSEHLDMMPPLRLVVADLGPISTRIDVPALTPAGVVEMVANRGVDPQMLHAITLGNPFFVEEVLRHPESDVPPTIQNAVLANVDGLPAAASELVGLVALSGQGLSTDLLVSLVPDAREMLDLPLQRRLLDCEKGILTCRHDLIRECLLQSMSPIAKRRRHLQLLEAVEASPGEPNRISRLAYHSVGAGVAEKALRYSMLAGDTAARVGAHRQASQHYVDALNADNGDDPVRRSQLLLAAATEDMTVNNNDRACAFAAERIDLAQSVVEEAKARAWLSYFQSRKNDLQAVRAEASKAIEALEQAPPCKELAIALSSISWVEAVEGNPTESLTVAEKAIDAARAVGAKDFEVKAALTAARLRSSMGDPAGPSELTSVVELAVAEGLGEFGATAMYALGAMHMSRFALGDAIEHLVNAAEYASRQELDAWYIASIATQATVNIWSGKWDEADHNLEIVLGQRTCVQTEVEILIAAATLRLRRGDPGAANLVTAVMDRAIGSTDREILETSCGLVLEAGWVGEIPMDAVREFYDDVVADVQIQDRINLNHLTFWAARLGFPPPMGEPVGPARFESVGRYEDGAAEWTACGFAIEPLLTTAVTPGADLHQVFSDIDALGAEGVSAGLRHELHRRGVQNVPRGVRPATRLNAGHLTHRETEVLALIAIGMSNAAIADELYISPKTVGHHVSAILSKVNASNRTEAVALAAASGWFEEAGSRN